MPLRAGAFIGLAFVPSIGATLVLALAAGVGSALFRPAVAAALPELVDADQRSAATALYGGIFSFGMTAGPAVAAPMLFVASPAEILAINGATFLVSGGLLASVPRGHGDPDDAEAASLWSATREGVRAAAQMPGIRALLVIGFVSVLAAAMMNVAEPLLATGPLAGGTSGYSLLVAVYGAGMLIGSVVNARIGSDVGNLRSGLLLGLALNGVGMVASAVAPSLGWAIGSFLLTGMSNSLPPCPRPAELHRPNVERRHLDAARVLVVATARRRRRDHPRRGRQRCTVARVSDLATKAGTSGSAPPRPIPPFTEEHEEFRQVVRRFVQTELAPRAPEWEDARWFPNEVFGRLAELGYIGLKFPEQYGGSNDPVADAVFAEEMAWCGSGGLAAGVGAHAGIALPPIWRFGTEDQKQRFLAPGIRGEKIAALAITEPDAGSDVASIRTRARKVDGGYVVNGSKTFITGGVRADVLVTAVKTTDDGGHHGISFLLVERGPGVTSSALEKLGWHASDTAEIQFDDVFVPDENLLGQENGGFYLIMANFQWERLLMALGAVGAMKVAFERTREFALQRRAFGKPIAHHQVIRHKLAEIAVKVEAGRDVTYAALRRYVAGEDAVREVTIAKLATQRSAFDVVDTCLQIHGGAGYMKEYGIERAARDARLGPIGGGTDEIMKEILGRSLGL